MTLSETVAVYKTCAAVYVSVGIVVAIVLTRMWVKLAVEAPFIRALLEDNPRLRSLLYAFIVSTSATLAAGWPTGLVAWLILRAFPIVAPKHMPLPPLSDEQANLLNPEDDDHKGHAVLQIVNAMVRSYGPVQARRIFEKIALNWEAFVPASPLVHATAAAVKNPDSE